MMVSDTPLALNAPRNWSKAALALSTEVAVWFTPISMALMAALATGLSSSAAFLAVSADKA